MKLIEQNKVLTNNDIKFYLFTYYIFYKHVDQNYQTVQFKFLQSESKLERMAVRNKYFLLENFFLL